jgi:SH3-like domain-containing protein
MIMQLSRWVWGWGVGVVVGISSPAAKAETADKPAINEPPSSQAKSGFPYLGEITGDSVYVRSRPDQNWYPTTRLKRGDRVEVYDEQFRWLKIRPPRGSFCYVDKSLVTREGPDKGVINGDNVYVRAGSDVPEPEYARKKSAVVMQLNKGAEVRILGEHPDGYYKIVPPKGAYYWISQTFVRRVGEGGIPQAESGESRAAPRTTEGGAARKVADRPIAEPSEQPEEAAVQTSSRPSESPRLVNAWEKKYDLIDAELKAALRQQPRREADLQAIKRQFVPIAEQDEELEPKEKAKVRLRQIDYELEGIAIRSRVERIMTGLAAERRQAAAALTTGTAPAVPVPARPDYEGKLMRSFAFEGRYRIVDPQDGKTVVYLEFPAGSGIDPASYVGRLVKIRMKQKRYDPEARRSIVEVAEIVPAETEFGATTAPVGPPAPVQSQPANPSVGVDSTQ